MRALVHLLLAAGVVIATPAQDRQRAPAPRFPNGLPTAPEFFPIGVWLQSPARAADYRALGINLYVGLYQGPTEAQLRQLAAASMRVICKQNDAALAFPGPTIVGWMHGDEPDNAQGRRWQGYLPPIPPWQIVADYERMHRADPTRPILLNLGQGAAWDGWHGRGDRNGRAEDYAEYLKGCDLASFDIYPVTHPHPDVKGKLEFVGRGVQRLRAAGGDHKPVWALIETGHVHDPERRPTPAEIRSEVWIAIASGAQGIVYFAHEFEPEFAEDALLQRAEIAAGVQQLNEELLALAPVLRARSADGEVQTATDGALAVRVHHHDGALHVLLASLQGTSQRVSLRRRAAPDAPAIEFELPGYGERRLRLPD
ncbi:MAG: beta-galactosidase [Planctomycetes bacterium]|nr:beta-galactosidase [Planctomycetota bacterium]